MFQIRRMSSVAAVAAEDAIDHGADNGNAIAGASTIAVAITGAAVVDRAAAAVVSTAAGSDDNTTATGVATRISATGGASHCASAAAAMPGRDLSAATTMTARMAGSQRICRHWHATQRDRSREGDESFFVKHVILLCFKQKFVCDCTDNA
jgi:hypothetical protein